MKVDLITQEELKEILKLFITKVQMDEEKNRINKMFEFFSKSKKIEKKAKEAVSMEKTAKQVIGKDILKEFGFNDL